MTSLRPLLRLILRALGLLLLGYGVALVVALLVVMATSIIGPDPLAADRQTKLFGVVFFLLGLVAAFGFALALGRWNCGQALVRLAAAVSVVIIWLTWDQPVTERLPLPLPPARAAESAAVLRYFVSFDGSPTTHRFSHRKLLFQVDPAAPEWRLFLSANRSAIHAEWAARSDLREWILALDQFDRIGDTPVSSGYSPVFEPLAYTVDLHCAQAGVLALDGRGDEALAVLRPILSVCRKLQADARNAVRFDVALGEQGLCQRAARSVLLAASASPAALAAFAVALEQADTNGQWRQLIATRCQDALDESRRQESAMFNVDGVPWVFRPFLAGLRMTKRCVFNPGATANLIIQEHARLANEAGESRGEGVRPTVAAIQRDLTKPAFKNFLGRHLAASHFAKIDRPLKRAWAIADDRRALLATCQAR